MREPYTQLYVHLVWSTWDRLPMITEKIKPRLYAAMAEKCNQLKCAPLAIGGIEDHCHLLVRLNPAISISDLVKEVKGSSSHLVNHELEPQELFKWQGAYGAFTVRKDGVAQVEAYILAQEEHHHGGKLIQEYEITEQM